jgi:alpha-amylase
MKKICFYFQVHQPMRLKSYRFFDISKDHNYFDEEANRRIMRKVADKCYLPMNQLLLDLIYEFKGEFKVSFSISGTALDQFEMYAQDVLDSFKRLADTGCVEFLAETYAHSLSALVSPEEFKNQVERQAKKIEALFGQKPKVFRNTELIYSNHIGWLVNQMGYKTMVTEGADKVLEWRSPNYLYQNQHVPELNLLLKNYKLSDDLAFRFSQSSWGEWPLTADKYVDWLNSISWTEEIVNLFMDYETFGEHQWVETGIFDFMYHLPRLVLERSEFRFCTPSEAVEQLQVRGSISVDNPISWADEERDLSAWLGNHIQDDAFESLYRLESKVKRINDKQLQQDWLYLQTSDHFYYMCTKFFADGDVHKYFNHYNTPYEAFINYMNVLTDFEERVNKHIAHLDGKVKVQAVPELKTIAKPIAKSLSKVAPKAKVAVKAKVVVKAKPAAKKKVVAKVVAKAKPVAKQKAAVKAKTFSKSKPAAKAKVAAKNAVVKKKK